MIVTVAPDPAIDLARHVDGLAPGATHRKPPGSSRAGSKGLSASRTLHQNGHEVLVLARAWGATSIFNEVSVPVSPTDWTACL